MTRRLIHTAAPRTNRRGQSITAKVYWDDDIEAFEVLPIIDGYPHLLGLYETHDREDALNTAAAMVVDHSNRP